MLIMEQILGKLIDKFNITRLILSCAIVGILYWITPSRYSWSVINSFIIFCIIYSLLTLIVWLCSKISHIYQVYKDRKDLEDLKNKIERAWYNEVRSYFYRLPDDVQFQLIDSYRTLKKDVSYINLRIGDICTVHNKYDLLFSRSWNLIKRNQYGTNEYTTILSYSSSDDITTLRYDPILVKVITEDKRYNSNK